MAFRLINGRSQATLCKQFATLSRWPSVKSYPFLCLQNHGSSYSMDQRIHSITQPNSVPTPASVASNSVLKKRKKDPLDLSFTNTKDAYKSKYTFELVRAYVVLTMSSFDFLVKNQDKVC